MAKLSIKIREYYLDKDGKAKINIELSHQTKTVTLKNLLKAKPGDWDKKRKKLKTTAGSYLNYEKENVNIHRELRKYEGILNDLNFEKTLQVHNVNQIRDMMLVMERKASMDVFKLFHEYIENLNSSKTKESYELSLKHLRDYENSDYMPIETLTSTYLENFEAYLKRTKNQSINTIAIYMRNIRSICNYAIRNDIMDYNNYPFRRYKIKTQKTRHRTIDASDIRKLIQYDGSMSENKARDLFMLSFYLTGMNFKDMLYFRPKDIYNGRIIGLRHKTQKPISVKIQPEAQAIMDKYKGDKYLLFMMEHKQAVASKNQNQRINPLHHDIVSQTNANLKKVCKKLGINVPLSTYYARHSWATIARKIGVDFDIIQQALTHSTNQVTSIYIEYDDEAIDAANRKVLDFLKE
jgi:site-specific recombinase XerD